jgi:uncharacterized protein YecE (DUF72 family)
MTFLGVYYQLFSKTQLFVKKEQNCSLISQPNTPIALCWLKFQFRFVTVTFSFIRHSMSEHTTCCYIGLPQWNHPEWSGQLPADSSSALAQYARHLSSVEGNTTFYGLPSADTVTRWHRETPDDFRFCFKLPKTISHERGLHRCDQELNTFLNRLAPLREKTGLLCLQLPESFSVTRLDLMERFFLQLPREFDYSVEVRNPDFFRKDDAEARFNRLLIQHGINRTSFDTRPLFQIDAADPATAHARQVKPNLPLHVLATGRSPMVRFITAMDWQSSTDFMLPWLEKITHWLHTGYSPFVFLHTPDNSQAPAVARYFATALSEKCPGQVRFNSWPDINSQQSNLF